MNTQTLTGRNILITGATGGIGRALALACARGGAQVLLVGRNVTKLESLYDEIVASGAPEPWIVPLDLATADASRFVELAAAIENEFDALHGVVHLAGVLGERTPLGQVDLVGFEQTLKVNVTAALALTQAVMPALTAAEDASVIFTSSTVGVTGRAYWGPYAISKFAVEGMAQVLRDELTSTSHIRVHVINPGATRTAMRAEAYPGENPATVPPPEQRVAAYVWLLSDAQGRTNSWRIDAEAWTPP